MAVAPKHVRVLLPHNTQPDHDVEEIGGLVLGNLYIPPGKNNFPAPPVDEPTLQTGVNDFTTAIAATVQGGTNAINAKNKKKHELVAMLRKLGLYVQAACNEDVATLTSSGFKAGSTVRVKAPLPKAVIRTVANGHTTQLLVTADPMAKANAWQLEIATVAAGGALGDWKAVGVFSSSRKMLAAGLTPGATYAFHVRAVGGSTKYSDWSDPVSHMAM